MLDQPPAIEGLLKDVHRDALRERHLIIFLCDILLHRDVLLYVCRWGGVRGGGMEGGREEKRLIDKTDED